MKFQKKNHKKLIQSHSRSINSSVKSVPYLSISYQHLTLERSATFNLFSIEFYNFAKNSLVTFLDLSLQESGLAQ